ncbi:BON domain-containing protein [Pararhizobium antarcticum]|uniref:Transporter n=1 Tax=Pararhizobium antarcticum TaxID=1798805 RepID=A0A657LT42_9HYPH|nr:BON domain-containing protein [Pararhizobium antarcticum]OJF93415.1 transporter [Pararhizobium antarcticum]OJG00481.1 transporter [Rhizobium sp. 58]
MVFKERTFYGEAPEKLVPQNPADLEASVADCLAVVSGLDASDIAVVAKDSIIVLSGTVMTLDESILAEEAARSIAGVANVDNRLVATAIRSTSTSS